MAVMPADKPWQKLYDEGVPRSLDYPRIAAHAFVESSARDFPDRPAPIFKGYVVNHREFNELTDRMAAGLAAMGVKKGDKVGLVIPNSPQFVIAFFGILKAGASWSLTTPSTPPGNWPTDWVIPRPRSA
jgi:long-chain acyl-CoA synthetase